VRFAYALAPMVMISFVACLVALWIGHVRKANLLAAARPAGYSAA